MNERKLKPISPAYDFFDNNFGHVVTFKDIKRDIGSFASVFCEGSVALHDLLVLMWENDIETRGCCIGHKDVHSYIKENILGKHQYISKEEYEAHANSKRYYESIDDEHAYIAFRPAEFGEAQELCDKIIGRMEELLPEFPFASNAFPDLITIALSEYVEAPQREEFFTVLSHVIKEELLDIEIEDISINDEEKTYQNLDSMIFSINRRNTAHQEVKSKEPHVNPDNNKSENNLTK